MSLNSPRKPLSSISANRMSNGSPHGSKKKHPTSHHSPQASLEISKEGRASVVSLFKDSSSLSSYIRSSKQDAIRSKKSEVVASQNGATTKGRMRAATMGSIPNTQTSRRTASYSSSSLFEAPFNIQPSSVLGGNDLPQPQLSVAAPKRQSTTFLELDDVEALLRQYTLLGDPSAWLGRESQGHLQDTPMNAASPNPSLPILQAPAMERSQKLFAGAHPLQPSRPGFESPRAHATERNSKFVSAIYGPSHAASPNTTRSSMSHPPSLSSSTSSTYSHQHNTTGDTSFASPATGKNRAPVVAASIDQLQGIIHDLQNILPYVPQMPQYKLDNLQASVDSFLESNNMGHQPNVFMNPNPTLPMSHAFTFTQPFPPAQPQYQASNHSRRHSQGKFNAFKDHAPESIMFIYEDGLGGESRLPGDTSL